jgi:hypothetical protein
MALHICGVKKTNTLKKNIMKNTILTIALLLGASASLEAQISDKSLLIDEVGQQYETSNAIILVNEELHINSQGKVTDANGEVVGYATKIGPTVSGHLTAETPAPGGRLDAIVKKLGL